MDAEDLKVIENQRQALLGQLSTAEAALRSGLQTRGFGNITLAHIERALAHVQEASVAINEVNRARTVEQLVNDLIRRQEVVDAAKRGKSHRI